MIKLIASDLDGTLLLNHAQSLNPGTAKLIHELTKQGRIFAAASGRQYPNLYRLFHGVEDEIAYICENGALVMYQGEVVDKHIIDRELGQKIMKIILDHGDTEVLLSGMNTCYVQPKDPAYAEHLIHVVKNNVTVVDDIFKVEEPYIKISLYEKDGAQHYEEWVERFKGLIRVVTSGMEWLDTIQDGVDKGSAIRALEKQFNVRPEEIMAFGDNYNDLEMLSEVKNGVAMENSPEAVKKICPYHTALVEDTLREILEGKYD